MLFAVMHTRLFQCDKVTRAMITGHVKVFGYLIVGFGGNLGRSNGQRKIIAGITTLGSALRHQIRRQCVTGVAYNKTKYWIHDSFTQKRPMTKYVIVDPHIALVQQHLSRSVAFAHHQPLRQLSTLHVFYHHSPYCSGRDRRALLAHRTDGRRSPFASSRCTPSQLHHRTEYKNKEHKFRYHFWPHHHIECTVIVITCCRGKCWRRMLSMSLAPWRSTYSDWYS